MTERSGQRKYLASLALQSNNWESLGSMLTYVHPDDRERFTLYFANILAGSPPVQYEVRIVRPDGAVRTLSILVGEIETAASPGSRHASSGCYRISPSANGSKKICATVRRVTMPSPRPSTEGVAIHETGSSWKPQDHRLPPRLYAGRDARAIVVSIYRTGIERRDTPADASEGPRAIRGRVEPLLHRDGTKTIGEMRARNFMYQGRLVRLGGHARHHRTQTGGNRA